jgi:AAA family ATP:ADP antiporter
VDKPPTSLERTLARLLRPFANVDPHEAISAVVMTLIVFLLLTAYYLLKTAREPLILLQGGAEVKSYAAAGQVVLLLGVVRAYSAVARRVGRMKLLAIVYLFFTSNLLVFAALARTNLHIGVAFFLWVGVFNYTAVAQFWSFAADIYSPEQGKRLFAILGIGSSVGAVAGAGVAKNLASFGPQALMFAAAALLVVCVSLIAWVERRERHGEPTAGSRGAPQPAPEQPLSHESAFHLLVRDRYLTVVAVMTLLLSWCNSSGEYILDRTLLASVDAARSQGMNPQAFVAAFKASYFGWFNLVGVLLQLFAVSRIIAKLGVRNALLFLPAVAGLGYGLVSIAPVLALIRIVKIAENSLDYSLQNTARQALYLVTSRVEKYVGKTTVDTLIVRIGDVMSAVVVLIGSRIGLPVSGFAAINVILIVGWMTCVFSIGGEFQRRSTESPEDIAAEPIGT